jgi:hypothetical protein
MDPEGSKTLVGRSPSQKGFREQLKSLKTACTTQVREKLAGTRSRKSLKKIKGYRCKQCFGSTLPPADPEMIVQEKH